MIPPVNPWYRKALAAPHEPYSRIEVWRAGIQVDELTWPDLTTRPYVRGAPVFLGGTVRATLGSRVTRNMSITVPDYLYPRKVDALLNPYGTELRAFRGVRYGNDSPDEFPIFVGRVRKARPGGGGIVTIEASDTTLQVARAGFRAPMASQVGALVIDEFERLVLDANPRAVFGPHDALTERVPALAYDSDRGSALDNLAKTATAFWYALADGRYVLRRVPWTRAPTTGAIVLTDGEGGTLRSAYPDRDASELWNEVTVISERPDGGPPLYATASDNDPTSPTFVGGPFGVASIQQRVTAAANQGQLYSLAQELVQRGRSLTESWSLSCVPDGSIELGDPLDITYEEDQAVQIVAGFTMPLDPTSDMTLDGRGLSLFGAEDLL